MGLKDMASELKAEGAGASVAVSVGERVTVGDYGAEYVVIDVDHATGRLELLHLKPGPIERNIPLTAVQKSATDGSQLVGDGEK